MEAVLHEGGNSLEGLEKARRCGLGIVEADIMVCAPAGVFEGALAVHPGSVAAERTAAGHLACSVQEAEAQALEHTGKRPLRLETLCQRLVEAGLHGFFETKVPGTFAMIRETIVRFRDRLSIISFVGTELEVAHRAGFQTGCLIKHDPTTPVLRAMKESYGASLYLPDVWYLTAATVRAAQEMGFRVFPWDIDEARTAKLVSSLGIDGVITAEPEILRASTNDA